VSEWIDVQKKLPKRGLQVLVWITRGRPEVKIGARQAKGFSPWYCNGLCYQDKDISHWQPLPSAPPEASQRDK